MALATFLDILFYISLFKIELTKSQLVKVSLLTGIIKFCLGLVLRTPLYILANIFVGVIILHFILKQTFEKSVLGETVNMLIMTSVKVALVKYISLFTENYVIILEIAMIIAKVLSIVIIRTIEIHIELGNHLQVSSKKLIYMISLLGIVLSVESDIQTSSYFLNILSIILYVYIVIDSIQKIELTEVQDEKITFLEMHNKTLANLYEKVKTFRHDFANFALALDGYARVGNMDGVKRLSKKALEHCKEVNRIGVLNPNLIANPAIYSILTNKFYHAQEQGITMNIEILDTLSDQESNSYEVCRILGILLDNAIEAARITEEKIINVSFIKDAKQSRKLIVIENSYNNKTVDVIKIFEKGYTSKEDVDKESHGIGLWNIKSILMKNEDLNLYTTADELFRQQLEIY